MRPLKTLSLWLIGWALLTATAVGPAEAASSDADGTYTVTVTRIEISTDGTNFTTVFDGSSAINIASASAGAVAAGLVSGVSVPPGSYTTVRTTVGANLLVKGYRNISSRTYYTNGGTGTDGFSNVAGEDQQNSQSNYAISTFTIPAGSRINTATISPAFTVKEDGSPSTVSVSFDTSGVIIESGGGPSVGAPVVSVAAS